MVLENAVDIAAAYPDLFINAQAMRNAKRTVYFSYRESPIGESHSPLSEVRYQRHGVGQKMKSAYFNSKQIPDIRDWLSGYLGELRFCEIPIGLFDSGPDSNIAPQYAGIREPVARQAHNLKVIENAPGSDYPTLTGPPIPWFIATEPPKRSLLTGNWVPKSAAMASEP